LLLSSYQGELFLGLQSSELSYGSVCIAQDDQIKILHSSAALGTAIYQKDESQWNLTQEFSWCCRSMFPVSQSEALYNREGWLASTGRLGKPDQMEYQIAMNDNTLTLAVVFQEVVGDTNTFWWPKSLVDGCLKLVENGGTPPKILQVSLENWATVRVNP
jgi:hypothetical protein